MGVGRGGVGSPSVPSASKFSTIWMNLCPRSLLYVLNPKVEDITTFHSLFLFWKCKIKSKLDLCPPKKISCCLLWLDWQWLLCVSVSHSVMSDSCYPVDCSPLGSSVHGISQGSILEWVATSCSGVSSWRRDGIQVSCIAGSFLHCRQILYQLSHQGYVFSCLYFLFLQVLKPDYTS